MRKTDSTVKNKYALKYWPTWLGLICMIALAHLPHRFQMALGKVLGELIFRLNVKRVKVARLNIDLCFPELSAQDRKQLLRRNLWHTGCWLIDTPRGLARSNKKLSEKLDLVDVHYLDEAKKQSKGVLLLGAHFLCMDMVGSLVSWHRKLDVVYANQPNALYNNYIFNRRLKSFPRVIERRDFRQLIRAFKENHAVWFTPDQDHGPSHGVFAPFFGVEAATVTTVTKIAKITGCKIVPIAPYRKEDFSGYTLRFFPPIEDIPGESEYKDALRVNGVLEEMIRISPENYLWVHKRFKSRPDGTKNTLYRK